MTDLNSGVNFMFDVDESLYIQLSGKITPKETEAFMKDIHERIENITQEFVVFDFRDIQGMNSLILGMMARVWQVILDQNKPIRVLARPHVSELLKLSRLDSLVEIYLLHENVDS